MCFFSTDVVPAHRITSSLAVQEKCNGLEDITVCMLLAYVSTSGARNSQDIREYSNLPRSLMLSHVFELHSHQVCRLRLQGGHGVLQRAGPGWSNSNKAKRTLTARR